MPRNEAPKVPDIHQLPDGSRLSNPQDRPLSMLRLDQWVRVDEEPWRIADMRQSPGGGRIVHLDGSPLRRYGHDPVSLTSGGTLPVYNVTPAPERAPVRRR
jgi:hypothetical protein